MYVLHVVIWEFFFLLPISGLDTVELPWPLGTARVKKGSGCLSESSGDVGRMQRTINSSLRHVSVNLRPMFSVRLVAMLGANSTSQQDSVTGQEVIQPGTSPCDVTARRTGEGGEQLTMGIIGCLPDNVQQAIKSFSIRDGKQHVTIAFSFMEDLMRRFTENTTTMIPNESSRYPTKFQWITPALFLDSSPEVIHGFETLVTLVPSTFRSSHLVGLLTVNQKGTKEGLKRHLDTLVSCLVTSKTAQSLWHPPMIATELSGNLLEEVLDSCSKAVLKIHVHTMCHMFPGRRPHDILGTIKKKILRPSFISHRELLQMNVQEVTSRLNSCVGSLDAGYFRSLVDLLQSPACTAAEFRRVHVYFMSSQSDPAVKEFWRVWSHEQVAVKVFPVTASTYRLGSLCYTSSSQGEMCLMNQQHPVSITSLASHVPHVPLKEGLQSVIKCLKSQDMGTSPSTYPEGKTDKIKPGCSCAVCRCDGSANKFSRRGDKAAAIGNSGTDSAFHRPVTRCNSTPLYTPHPSIFSNHPQTSKSSTLGLHTHQHPAVAAHSLRGLSDRHQNALHAPFPQHTMGDYYNTGNVIAAPSAASMWRMFTGH